MGVANAKYAYPLALLVASVLLSIFLVYSHPYVPLPSLLSIGGAAIAFGSVSGLVSLQRSYFLAHVMPHIVLFTAPLSVILEHYMGGNAYMYSVILTLALAYLISLARGRVDSDVLASLSIAFLASLSAITIYEASRLSRGVSVYALILGDPLLSTFEEALLAISIGLLAATASILVAKEVALLGLDRQIAQSASIKVTLYDSIVLLLTAITSAVMIKIAGFLIVIVSLLLPGATSITISRGARYHVVLSTAMMVLASVIGMNISVLADIPVSAGIAVALLLLFLATWVISSVS